MDFALSCQSRNMGGQFKKVLSVDQSIFYIFSHSREFKFNFKIL